MAAAQIVAEDVEKESDVVVTDETGEESAADEQGARVPRVARRPYTPTKAELEEHLPLHLEYRSWCEACVKGRGVERAHHRTAKEERG